MLSNSHRTSVRLATASFACWLLLPQSAAQAAVSFDQWMRIGMRQFDDAPATQELLRSIQAQELSSEAASRQSPLTLKTRVHRSAYGVNPDWDPDLTGTLRQLSDLTVTQEVLLETRSSFKAGLSASYSSLQYQPLSGFDSSSQPFNLGLTLSYDLLKGGSDSPANLRARAESLEFRRERELKQQALLDSRIRYMQLISDLYVSSCKIAFLRAVHPRVQKTVTAGKVKVKTRTISYLDYLTFVDLEATFGKRLVEEETRRIAFLQEFSTWETSSTPNKEIQEILSSLQSGGAECKPALASIKAGISSWSRMNDEEIRQLAIRMPSYRGAVAQRSASEARFKETRERDGLSISPFVSGGYIREEFSQTAQTAYSVGVALEWNLPAPHSSYETAAARAGFSSADMGTQRAFRENLAKLRTLQARVQAQENIIEVLNRAVDNSLELLKTIDVQQSIGSADSLNYVNAYLGGASASDAYLDNFAALQKDLFELAEYRKLAAQAPKPSEP